MSKHPEEAKGLSLALWERRLRLWSGLVLFTFVSTHLLNHIMGLFGQEALEIGQGLRWASFGTPPGLVLLYGSFLVHIALAARRVVARQTMRMPLSDAVQILAGMAIPALLIGHIVATRIAYNRFDADITYSSVLANLWPAYAWWQSALVVVAWTHGCIGIDHVMRFRKAYIRFRAAALIAAVLIPVLALAGFVAGGREARAMMPPPSPPSAEQSQMLKRAAMQLYAGYGALGLLAVALVGAGVLRRRAAQQVTITYRGRGPVRVPRGTSVLEASRVNDIPHPSVCGGRGRCATCRVHITSRLDRLPEPGVTERAVLAGIGAPADVRLACQLRPTGNIGVSILLPVLGRGKSELTDSESREWAVSQEATVLIVDMRAFNTLVRSQQPYEIAILVNRFRAEMTQAVRHHKGEVGVFYGDGLIAVFGVEEEKHHGARAALRAAGDVARVLAAIDREMGGALALPIRAGIGIHTGQVLLARIGEDSQRATPMALGPTVNIAKLLEDATKEALADCLISEAAANASGYDFTGVPLRDIVLTGQENPVRAYAMRDAAALLAVLDKGRARAAGTPVAPTAEETA
jgi:adenylate cyclase